MNLIDVAELTEILACRTPMVSVVSLSHVTDLHHTHHLNADVNANLPHPQDALCSNSACILDIPSFDYRFMKKITPMLDNEYELEFEWKHKFSKLDKKDYISVNDVFQLIPHSGLLKPNEIQYINVAFKPKPNINVRALLECEVLGGPPESIIVTGQSANLMYQISTHRVNYKIRSFHENATQQLDILNVSQLPFEIKTYLTEAKCRYDLYGNILNLIPSEKLLEPEEQIDIKIEIRPGVMGYFHRTFLLEIGHLPVFPIEIFGWGVIPQIYLSLPRPALLEVKYLFVNK